MQLTKREQHLLGPFNQAETTVVISHWPFAGQSFDGVATYTENLVSTFAATYDHKFVVMVPYLWRGSRVRLISKNILVVGVFDEHKLHLYPKILTWLNYFSHVKCVVVHSEFCASGGMYVRAMVVPFLALIKLTGRHISYYAHNVAEDIGEYAEHLGLSRGIFLQLTRIGYWGYLKLLRSVVDRFVVLEQSVADRLRSVMGEHVDVVVTPHWVAPKTQSLTKVQARKALGISPKQKLVVSFGFLSWYKGSDVVVRAAKYVPKSYMLVLAGGEAVSLQDKEHYQAYYYDLTKSADLHDQVWITGFLTDEEIDLWLAAADVALLPYRLSMGGSGALQQALQRGVSILMSQAIAIGTDVKWVNTFDGNDSRSLARALRRYFSDKNMRALVAQKTQALMAERALATLLPAHYTQIYAPVNIDSKMLELSYEESI